MKLLIIKYILIFYEPIVTFIYIYIYKGIIILLKNIVTGKYNEPLYDCIL